MRFVFRTPIAVPLGMLMKFYKPCVKQGQCNIEIQVFLRPRCSLSGISGRCIRSTGFALSCQFIDNFRCFAGSHIRNHFGNIHLLHDIVCETILDCLCELDI